MTLESLQASLKKEEEKYERLLKKQEETTEQIKNCENNIRRMRRDVGSQKFDEATDVLKARGLNLEELMEAIKNGDLFALQEKLEANAN